MRKVRGNRLTLLRQASHRKAVYFTSSTENLTVPLGLMRGVCGVVLGGVRAGDGGALLWTGDFRRVSTGLDLTGGDFEVDGRLWFLSDGGIGASTTGISVGDTAAASRARSSAVEGSSGLI